jgi:hypothetical protein
MIRNLTDVYSREDELMALLKEIEARYFYLLHDALNYDTVDGKTYEAIVHLGDVINPDRLKEYCSKVSHVLDKFHYCAGTE